MKLERLTLPLAASLLLAAGVASADDATEARVRNVDVRKIVVAGDGADAPHHGVFVSRVQTNGDDPVTQLQVLGSDAEAIAIDDLADGETRSIDLGDGRWADLTRDGEMLRLELDDQEIEIPLNPAANGMLPGLDGAKQVQVFMVAGDELHADDGAHGVMTFIGEDGSIQHPAMGEGFEWHEDGDAMIGSRVVVKHLGDGTDDENVRVMALPAFPLHGMLGGAQDLENLKALEGADPEVRERVLAALQEILGNHHAVTIDMDVQVDDDAAPGERKVIVRRAAPVEEH